MQQKSAPKKRVLFKISGDSISLQKKGYYKDQNGFSLHGVYKRDYSKTQDILFINNGYLMMKYKFPKINTKFQSPMLNTFNLRLCGGSSWSNIDLKQETLVRVINNLKPMGDIIDTIKNINSIAKILDEQGLKYSITPHFRKDFKCIRFCKDNSIIELFNLKDLYEDYCTYFFTIFKVKDGEYRHFLKKIKDRRLIDFLDFNIFTPRFDSDVIITGLILGYPVWSTVSIMWMAK